MWTMSAMYVFCVLSARDMIYIYIHDFFIPLE
jgi:hypothetical protein